jgi:hypothetical protein
MPSPYRLSEHLKSFSMVHIGPATRVATLAPSCLRFGLCGIPSMYLQATSHRHVCSRGLGLRQMEESLTHAALSAEIARLRDQQLKDIRDAAFVGWTRELVAEHEKREHQLVELQRFLTILEVPSPLAKSVN